MLLLVTIRCYWFAIFQGAPFKYLCNSCPAEILISILELEGFQRQMPKVVQVDLLVTWHIPIVYNLWALLTFLPLKIWLDEHGSFWAMLWHHANWEKSDLRPCVWPAGNMMQLRISSQCDRIYLGCIGIIVKQWKQIKRETHLHVILATFSWSMGPGSASTRPSSIYYLYPKVTTLALAWSPNWASFSGYICCSYVISKTTPQVGISDLSPYGELAGLKSKRPECVTVSRRRQEWQLQKLVAGQSGCKFGTMRIWTSSCSPPQAC